MRMTSPGRSSKTAKSVPLVVFSIGGRRAAARAEEVGGIWPWTATMVVPSGTLYINAIMRRGDEVMPVFDLAGRLGTRVNESSRLCLIAKRHDGAMAVCIDGAIPTLHMIDLESVRSVRGAEADVVGICRIGEEEMTLYSLRRLGLSEP